MRYQLNIAKIIVLSRAGDHRSPLQKRLKYQYIGALCTFGHSLT
ncbi:MAG: hypothetical protein R3Y53_02555 [Bacillota bacterium]